jgi:hypothetical protein
MLRLFPSGKEDFRYDTADCARVLRRFELSDEEILRIATLPQRSPEWHGYRQYRLTMSNIGAAVGHMEQYKKPADLLRDLVWTPTFKGNEACAYGTDRESLAHDSLYLHMYDRWVPDEERMTGGSGYSRSLHVQEIGLLIDRENPWMGASPDDLVFCYDRHSGLDIGLAEYKAPWKTKDFYPECPHQYYDQMQGQMAVANGYLQLKYGVPADRAARWTKFVEYTPGRTRINDYAFNSDYWHKELFPMAKEFYYTRVLPLIVLKERGVLEEGQIDLQHRLVQT